MAVQRQISMTNTQPKADDAGQFPPCVAVMLLPDGSEILLHEGASGWVVTPNGRRHAANGPAVRPSDRDLLLDIAAAYGFGPQAPAATHVPAHDRRAATVRPRLTLVSSRGPDSRQV